MSDNTHTWKDCPQFSSLYSWSCKNPANWYPNSLTVTALTSLICASSFHWGHHQWTKQGLGTMAWNCPQNLIAGTQLGTDLSLFEFSGELALFQATPGNTLEGKASLGWFPICITGKADMFQWSRKFSHMDVSRALSLALRAMDREPGCF